MHQQHLAVSIYLPSSTPWLVCLKSKLLPSNGVPGSSTHTEKGLALGPSPRPIIIVVVSEPAKSCRLIGNEARDREEKFLHCGSREAFSMLLLFHSEIPSPPQNAAYYNYLFLVAGITIHGWAKFPWCIYL